MKKLIVIFLVIISILSYSEEQTLINNIGDKEVVNIIDGVKQVKAIYYYANGYIKGFI